MAVGIRARPHVQAYTHLQLAHGRQARSLVRPASSRSAYLAKTLLRLSTSQCPCLLTRPPFPFSPYLAEVLLRLSTRQCPCPSHTLTLQLLPCRSHPVTQRQAAAVALTGAGHKPEHGQGWQYIKCMHMHRTREKERLGLATSLSRIADFTCNGSLQCCRNMRCGRGCRNGPKRELVEVHVLTQ